MNTHIGHPIVTLLCALILGAGCTTMIHSESAKPSNQELFPFVLPWDDATPGITDVSAWLEKPAGGHGFVTARDGHLYTGDKRIRFLGVNVTFGACFPRHDDAEKVAARMAKFGINCVRFHHMDSRTAPDGLFLDVPASDARYLRALDPGQLEKLDYFIARLKRHGIYADLNLHVSRTYPGLPTWEGMPSYFKGVDNFYPRMIDLQRDYARDLLTHRNPYTKTRYVEEPAVAFIEINNENALMVEWWNGGLDAMPDPYAADLRRQWNAWLKAKYPDTVALKQAWGAREEPLGAETLANAGFTRDTGSWNLEQHEGARAAWQVTKDGPKGGLALRLQVLQPGREAWHVQLNQAGLHFRQGRPYTFEFWAKADAPRRITVNAMQAHDPWRQLWSSEARLTTEWQPFRFIFSPSDTEENGRVTFSGLGAQPGTCWLAGVSLKPGGVLGLRAGEQLGTVDIFPKRDFAGRPVDAQRDWIRFLWEMEERYWTGMDRFLKEDLHARGLVIGTQMGYSPFPIQAKLDVVDSHAYWQHPRFPGRPWDPADWFVSNVSMVRSGTQSTVAGLALRRPYGKPFICTEYNHSAPNTFASEAFLLLGGAAALQDWDGIFAFAYAHRRDDWDERRIPNFFDIDQHPTKMASLPAVAALFTRADLQPPPKREEALMTPAMAIDRVRVAGPTLGADAFGVERRASLQRRVGVGLTDTAPSPAKPSESPGNAADTAAIVSDNGELSWDAGRGVVTVNAPRSKMFVGFIGGGPYDLGGIRIAAAPNRQNWATITVTAMDGGDFQSSGHVLITATGYAENTNMGWKNAEKSSVGRDWGTAPSLVEGIPATITLPVPAARVHAWSLDERGRRKTELPVRDAPGGHTALDIGPRYRTLWYEVEIR